MEKKTIGGFIAALRKARGMTQQEVADRLNVSNKAVSRWERDECAPDLSLIPAIAELFDVTCDELLKGERIFSEPQREKSEPKVEKQIKALVNRAISRFKTLILISFALSAVGLVCMFGISYGFYRSSIAFAVMMLFEVASFVVAAIAVNKLKEIKADNELFETADNILIERFDHTLGQWSCRAFFAILSVILLSLPIIYISPDYYVLYFDNYLRCAVFVVIILAFLYLHFGEKYVSWVTGKPFVRQEYDRSLRLMNILQLLAVILAAIAFAAAPWFDTEPHQTSPAYVAAGILGLTLLVVGMAVFVVFAVVFRQHRKVLLLPGIRNSIIAALCFMMVNFHSVSFSSAAPGSTVYYRGDTWNLPTLITFIGSSMLVCIIFKIIDKLTSKKTCLK